ncbi:MAG: LysE family transporter [Acetanaerobacterium sp.]
MFNAYTFLAYIFIMAFTPGPNNIMAMTNASRYGFRKSFPFNLGILVGFSIVMAVCAVFSTMLVTIIPSIKPVMIVLGAAYMLYLAWKILRSSSIKMKESKSAGFVTGMLLQFVNPKIMIYGITAMSTYILPYYNEPHEIALFASLLVFVGFSGTVCWSVFGMMLYKLFLNHAKVMNTIMALLLVYCAASLFL